MKAFYFLIPLFMVNACKTQTGTINSSDKTTMENTNNMTTGCPKDGTCEVVLHQNKKLEIIDNGNGRKYSQIVEGENLVIEYTYLRPGPEGTADGNYFESIQFEVPAITKNLVKENAALADIKLAFGKQAYRNSEYYPVTNGKLSFQKTGNNIHFDLKFKIAQTSQVLSHISGTLKVE